MLGETDHSFPLGKFEVCRRKGVINVKDYFNMSSSYGGETKTLLPSKLFALEDEAAAEKILEVLSGKQYYAAVSLLEQCKVALAQAVIVTT